MALASALKILKSHFYVISSALFKPLLETKNVDRLVRRVYQYMQMRALKVKEFDSRKNINKKIGT
jgi:hypothetical protein